MRLFELWVKLAVTAALGWMVCLPADVAGQTEPAEQANGRAATLTPGEEWSDIPSLEEAEQARERFRATAAEDAEYEAPTTTIPFEDLFYNEPDGQRERYAITRRTPQGPLEEHLRSIRSDIEFTEEMHCVAQHFASVFGMTGQYIRTMLRYRPMAQCGLLSGRPDEVLGFVVTDDWFRECAADGIEGADDPWLCAVHHGYELPPLPQAPDEERVVGVGVHEGAEETHVVVITVAGQPDIAPIDRVLRRPADHVQLRLRGRNERISATFAVLDGRPSQRCHDNSSQGGRSWVCPLPADADTLSVEYYWNSDTGSCDNLILVHRAPPPAIPPPIDMCEGLEVAPHEVTADVVRGWINASRAEHGLAPLTATAEHDEWMTLIHRFGDQHETWVLPSTGLAFDGLIAADQTFSPILYSDEPCRELLHMMTYAPELASMIYSPYATHLAVGTVTRPGVHPGVDLQLHVVEEDSPEYRSAIENAMRALLQEHSPRSLDRYAGQRQTPAMILGNVHALIEVNGENVGQVLDTVYVRTRLLHDQGGSSMLLNAIDVTSPMTLTWRDRVLYSETGTLIDVVRRPQFRVNRVVYHILWMQFRP